MKNLIYTILVIFGYFSYAQEGVTLPYHTLSYNVANGTYIKDLNDELLPYVGVWKGNYTLNGLNLQAAFTITRIKARIESLRGNYYYRDKLVSTLTVKNNDDLSVYFTTGNATEYRDFYIHNRAGVKQNELMFVFYDAQHCNAETEFVFKDLQTTSGITTMKYVGYYTGFLDFSCPETSQTVTRVLPYGVFYLTKQ